MENPIFSALVGGVLIGVAASLLLWLNGRVAGVSGVIARLFAFKRDEWPWRFSFLTGLFLAGVLGAAVNSDFFGVSPVPSRSYLLLAAFLVGFGSSLGNGCTSGHGVCGISRLSPRSIVATLVFMFFGMLTVYVLRNMLGGLR